MKENAKTRRHYRRMLKAIENRKINESLGLNNGLQPLEQVSKQRLEELNSKQSISSRVCKAVRTETEYHIQILSGASKFQHYHLKPEFHRINNETGRQIFVKEKRHSK